MAKHNSTISRDLYSAPNQQTSQSNNHVQVRGARVHNLKTSTLTYVMR